MKNIVKTIKKAYGKIIHGRNKRQIKIPVNAENELSDFSHVILPNTIPDLPGMITNSEKRFYYWLIKNHFTGSGDIVEVGPWLGRSTTHLAAGLLDSEHEAKIYCFDKFEWLPNSGWTNKTGINLKQGDCFLEEFEKNLNDYSDYIYPIKTSIQNIKWERGSIEILVLDAPKRLSDISKILTVFGKYLIPQKSILIWQDFQHAPSFEIPATLSYLGDYLIPIYSVLNGCTVAFKFIKQWDSDTVKANNLSFLNWNPESAQKVWDTWLQIIPDSQKDLFLTGLAMLLHDIGYHDAGKNVILSTVKVNPDQIIKPWQHYANTSLYRRYRPLFDIIKIKPAIR